MYKDYYTLKQTRVEIESILQILEDLKTEFKRMKVPDIDAISIYNKKNLVVIAGETKHVDDMYEKIKTLIDSMEQTLDSKGKQITKMLNLSRHEVELLPATTLTESLTNVQIRVDKQNMIFKVRTLITCNISL